MDCKHEEYDMEGKHCKLSHCAVGVGMRCKKDYGEWCSCYESINSKKKHKKPSYKYYENKEDSVRKSAESESAFVDLLNTELKELIKNLPIITLRKEITKLAHEAHSKRDESATNYDKKLLNVDYSNWNRYEGQFEAYANVVKLIDNILEVSGK